MKTDALTDFLKSEFKRKQARNPKYSLRSYARDLGLDPSNLSKILSEQKMMGPGLQKKLAAKLGFATDELFSNKIALDTRDKDYHSHALKTFEVVSGWQHYAILELYKLDGFSGEPLEISKKLGVSKQEAMGSIKRLRSTGLLKRSSNGKWRPAEESSSTLLQSATSAAHRRQQREILEGAIDALEKTPIEHRSQSSITMAIDREKLDEAKELIKNFRRDLGRFLSRSENLNEVYQLSISLYPVTNQEKI